MFQQQTADCTTAICLSVTQDKPVYNKICLTTVYYTKMVSTFKSGKWSGEHKLGARQPVSDTSERHVLAVGTFAGFDLWWTCTRLWHQSGTASSLTPAILRHTQTQKHTGVHMWKQLKAQKTCTQQFPYSLTQGSSKAVHGNGWEACGLLTHMEKKSFFATL